MEKFLAHLQALSDQLDAQIKASQSDYIIAKTTLETSIKNILDIAQNRGNTGITSKLQENWDNYLKDPSGTNLKLLESSFKQNFLDSGGYALKKFSALDKNQNPELKFVPAIDNIKSAFEAINSIDPSDKTPDKTYPHLRNYSEVELLQPLKTDIDALHQALSTNDFVRAKEIFDRLPQDFSNTPIIQGDLGTNYQNLGQDIFIIRSLLDTTRLPTSNNYTFEEAVKDIENHRELLNPPLAAKAHVAPPADIQIESQPITPITRKEPEKADQVSTIPQPKKITTEGKDQLIKVLDNLTNALIVTTKAQENAAQNYADNFLKFFAVDSEAEKLMKKDQDNIAQKYGSFDHADESNIKKLQEIKETLLPNLIAAVKDLPTKKLINEYEKTLGSIDFEKLEEEIRKKEELEKQGLSIEEYREKAKALPKTELTKIEELKKTKKEIGNQQYIIDVIDGSNLKLAKAHPDQHFFDHINNPDLKKIITEQNLGKTPANPKKTREAGLRSQVQAFNNLIKKPDYNEKVASELFEKIMGGIVPGYTKIDQTLASTSLEFLKKISLLERVLTNNLNYNENDPIKTNTFSEAIDALPRYNELISLASIAELPIYVNRSQVSEIEAQYLQALSKQSGIKTLNKTDINDKKDVEELERVIEVLKGNRDYFTKDGHSGVQISEIENLKKDAKLTSVSLIQKLEATARSFHNPVPTGKEK